ncbi:Transient receptor potential cation channel subfamily M member-like 2 [Lamellibrachia satsuma]|nr:Transient receptor potential cation channel subfamily M member-like 2 [Lamellibrachia satsuma]
MGKMEPTTKRRSIFFALLFPLLVWFSTIIDFRSDAWEEKDEQTDRRSPYGYNGTCWKQLIAFYRSPIVIYCGYCLSHVIFLGLFSYILLTDFHLEVTKKEWVIVFWVGVVIMEEIRQMRNDVNRFKNKIDGFRHHFKDMWNFLDAVTLIAFFVGFLFRYVSPHYMIMRTISCLEVARIIFALDLMLFYLRTLDIYYLHRKLGPQLVMITEMMVDMWYVIIIIMVFVVAYGVALQAILYPNSPLDFTLMSKMFKKAYFQIYGELFLEELGGTLDCETTLMANSTLPRCPQNTDFIPTFLMAIYILFTNVLLLNLLIAMFSNTFNKIQMDTDEHWFFLRYFLIKEFDDRPSLAPPLTILYHLYLGIRKCNNSYCGKCERPTDFKVKYLDDLDKELIRWEKENVDDYVNKTDRQQTLENRVEELQNSVYNMAGDLEDMKDMKDMLRKMAEQMEKILKTACCSRWVKEMANDLRKVPDKMEQLLVDKFAALLEANRLK